MTQAFFLLRKLYAKVSKKSKARSLLDVIKLVNGIILQNDWNALPEKLTSIT